MSVLDARRIEKIDTMAAAFAYADVKWIRGRLLWPERPMEVGKQVELRKGFGPRT